MQREYDFKPWGDRPPKASCICITYGRPHIVGEAVESFLRQDYPGEKELVVLNDQEGVTLELEPHPEIVLVNEAVRYPTIGTKRKAATALSDGQLVFPWDDDDISLPWRLSVNVERIGKGGGGYFKPEDFWWWTGDGRVEHKSGVICHPMCAYSRELFDRVGGYPEMQSGQDQGLESRVNEAGMHETAELGEGECFYVYRMAGIETYHLSHYGYGKGFEECEEYVRGKFVEGVCRVEPVWSHDYPVICAAASCSS